MTSSFKMKFIILSIIITISGFSQGMLLPLISFVFESREINATLNGLHASSLYIGVFLSALFIEAPLRKYGYRFLIIWGGGIVGVSLLLFPILDSIWIWFFLRLLVGIGDNALHFSTQTWLTELTPRHKIGKIIAIYGLFFSFGFMIGPKISQLVVINESLPFIISGGFTMLAWPLIFLLRGVSNAKPDNNGIRLSFFGTIKNFKAVLQTSWIAFFFPLLFGFMEASLNSNYPVFALRNDFNISQITWILPAFSLGAILLQVPIGSLGDRFGRMKFLNVLLILGGTSFILMEFFTQSFIGMIVLFVSVGIFLGSTYSLGISYMTDITPKNNLPAGNLMAGIFYSIGSMVGPILGGAFISMTHSQMYFSMFAIITALILILNLIFIFKQKNYKDV